MAEIIVKKSPVAEFLDELPTLIFQYKQMQIAEEQADLERADRKAARAEDILLKEYYSKKEEIKQTEAMFDKYEGLNPADVSSGGADIVNFIDEQNNIDMTTLQQNLEELSNYQSELKTGLIGVQSQAQQLRELTPSYYGLNRVLDEHEYEAFRVEALKSIEEGGLGWTTTAGADQEYYKKDAGTRYREALQITEHMQKDHTSNLKGDYAVIQQIFTPGEDKDTGDIVNLLTYKNAEGVEIEPSEDVVGAMQRMVLQTSPEEFLQNLNSLPDEYGGKELRELLMSNPNTMTLYGNMMRNQKAIETLDNELAGINDLPEQTQFDQFVTSIEGITNEKVLFKMYNEATRTLDPSLHEAYFSAIEAATGGEDLYPQYAKEMGFSGTGGDDFTYEFEQKNITQSQKDLAAIEIANLQNEITQDSTYIANYESSVKELEDISGASWERYLELAKLDPDNFDALLLPETARMVWWGLFDPQNAVQQEIAELGARYRAYKGTEMRMTSPYAHEKRLEENRAKKAEIERTLELLEGAE